MTGKSAKRRRLWWIVGGAMGLLAMTVILLLSLAMRYPAINDISTDRTQAPAFLVSPPEVERYDAASLTAPTEKAYGDLVNLHAAKDPEAVFLLVQHLLAMRQWQVAKVDVAGRRVQAVASTRLLGFKDDIVIEVRADGGTSIVAMRSKSRLGKGDLGANARRIRLFLDDLQGLM